MKKYLLFIVLLFAIGCVKNEDLKAPDAVRDCEKNGTYYLTIENKTGYVYKCTFGELFYVGTVDVYSTVEYEFNCDLWSGTFIAENLTTHKKATKEIGMPEPCSKIKITFQ